MKALTGIVDQATERTDLDMANIKKKFGGGQGVTQTRGELDMTEIKKKL